MEDVLTDIPPPSRFFQEDLSNFTPPPPPPLPSPFLVFSNPNNDKPLHPSLLVFAISSPSLHLLHHFSSKTLIGSVILPEITFSGNTIEPSLKDKSCNVYSLDAAADNPILLVSVQYFVVAERSHAFAKLLIGGQIVPDRVLILDSVQSRNYRGKLSPDEAFALKLETSSERRVSRGGSGSSSWLNSLEYFPSGSMIDGLAAALLGRCQMRKLRGTLCVSWPECGPSAMSLVKSVLFEDLFHGLELITDDDCELGKIETRHFDPELYT